MNRIGIGIRLLNWHSSMHDPIYAVGSFYFGDKVYPDRDTVSDALQSVCKMLREFRAMDRGKPVMVERGGLQVSLKDFAGYDRKTIRENIRDLREIAEALSAQYALDYD
jgi:hypothetical protein